MESNQTNVSTPAAAPAAEKTKKVTVYLDRTYIHSGRHFGPGAVEVDPALAADLNVAQARMQKRDQKAGRRTVAQPGDDMTVLRETAKGPEQR